MGKLPSFLQLGGVFADFSAAAPAVASTYLVNQWRSPRGAGAGPGQQAGRPGEAWVRDSRVAGVAHGWSRNAERRPVIRILDIPAELT